MAAPKLSERRVSQRYAVFLDTVGGRAVFEKTISLPLIDISYGGFSVSIDKAEHQSLCDTLPRTSDVGLSILGVHTSGRAIRVFENKQRLGYAFCHDTAGLLIFLRRFIEFMRMGEHINTIDKTVLKPPFDSPHWLCLRGDGPTDVAIRLNPNSTNVVDEAVITFREKESYRTAEIRSGKVITFVSSEAKGYSSSGAAQDAIANEDIVRKSACILIGHLQVCQGVHQPAVLSLLSTLRRCLLSQQEQRTR